MTSKFSRTHGSTGTQPADGKEFVDGERPDDQEFDWFWYNVHEKINSLIDNIANIVNGTTQVGNASSADNATNVTSTYKGNDLDADGDGSVDQADVADQAQSFEARSSDPSSPSDGDVWIRTDL